MLYYILVGISLELFMSPIQDWLRIGPFIPTLQVYTVVNNREESKWEETTSPQMTNQRNKFCLAAPFVSSLWLEKKIKCQII